LVNSRIRTLFLLPVAIFLFLQLAAAQAPMGPAPFSADMQMTSTRNANAPRDVSGKIYFGQGHMRMDMQGGAPGGGQSMIITDFKTQTTDILMPAQMMYMEHHAGDMPGRRQSWANIKPLADPNNPCAAEPGTTCKNMGVEQVNGRTCDHWQITDKEGKVSNVWVDQKLRFPIKTASADSTWELTNIKEGEPDASLFQIPPGYHKMDMSGMMQGMRPPQQ
jgi:Domain of unknown function (DUF4412)